MGLVEIVLGLFFVLPGALAAVLGSRSHRDETGRRPLPVPAICIAMASVVLGAGLGLLLGAPVVQWLLPPGTLTALVVFEPSDAWRAHMAAAQLPMVALALPGLVALAWLIVGRAVRPAVATAGSVFVGFVTAVGLAVVGLGPAPVPDDPALLELFTLVGIVQMRARALVGLGLAGAAIGAGVATAAVSPRGALWTTMAMPGLAMALAAWITPPDVISQILVGGAILMGWVCGLLVGVIGSRLG